MAISLCMLFLAFPVSGLLSLIATDFRRIIRHYADYMCMIMAFNDITYTFMRMYRIR